MDLVMAVVLSAGLAAAPPVPENAGSLFQVTQDMTIWDHGAHSALDLLLKKGEFLYVNLNPGSIPWMVTAGELIDAPPEKIYAVITDFPKYMAFMPQVEDVKRADPGDGLPEVTYTLGFRFAYVIPITYTYTLKYLPRPPLRLDWVGIKDGVRCHYGFWELVPLEGGKKTAAFYTLYSTPQWSLFRKLVDKNPRLQVSTVLSTALIVAEKIKERVEGAPPRDLTPSGPLTREEMNDAGLKDLASRGIFLIVENPDTQGRKFITGGALIRAPRERVWDSIVDLPDAPIIYPEVQKAAVVGEDRGADLVKLSLKVNYVLFSKRLSYVLRHVPDKPRRLSWTWVEGDGRDNTGTWDLVALEGDRETLAVYRLYSDMTGSGFVYKYIISRHPALGLAIQGSTVQVVVGGIKSWSEMSDGDRERARMAWRKRGSDGDGERPSIPGY